MLLTTLLLSFFFISGIAQLPLSFSEIENSIPETTVEVQAGTSSQQGTDVLSLAFKVSYSGTLASTAWDQTNSWMDFDGNCEATLDDDPANEEFTVTLTRTNGIGATGYGRVGQADFDNGTVWTVDNIDIRGASPIQIVDVLYAPKLYPIPATDQLHVDTNLEVSAMRIRDLQGRGYPVQGNYADISLAGLDAGIYFLEMETEVGPIVKKFSVAR